MDVSPRRIGILGGTFNPIHNGHILMAQRVREALSLETIFVIPAADPPHKEVDEHISAAHRFNMARLAVKDTGLSVSDIELRRGGKSYTVDTVRALTEEYPSARFTRNYRQRSTLRSGRLARRRGVISSGGVCGRTQGGGELRRYASGHPA